MPRKTRAAHGHRARTATCFNEAAARCRGKRRRMLSLGGQALASMRPRPDAAENDRLGPAVAASVPASMRPRPDAAENRPARTSTARLDMLQ